MGNGPTVLDERSQSTPAYVRGEGYVEPNVTDVLLGVVVPKCEVAGQTADKLLTYLSLVYTLSVAY